MPLALGVIAPAATGQPDSTTEVLRADTRRLPTVEVQWPVRDGVRRHQARCGYTAPGIASALGGNLDVYVALGGLRVERGAAHPRGAVVRVGLSKLDPAAPLFDGLPDASAVTVRATGIVMDRPAVPWPATLVMQMDYAQQDLAACGLGDATGTLIYTRSRTDDVSGAVTSENGRLGWLDGSAPERARSRLWREPDGSVSIEVTFPYAMLRHLQDRWVRTRPGTFLEPRSLTFEFEVLPPSVAAAISDPDARPRPFQPRPPLEEPEIGPPPG